MLLKAATLANSTATSSQGEAYHVILRPIKDHRDRVAESTTADDVMIHHVGAGTVPIEEEAA